MKLICKSNLHFKAKQVVENNKTSDIIEWMLCKECNKNYLSRDFKQMIPCVANGYESCIQLIKYQELKLR